MGRKPRKSWSVGERVGRLEVIVVSGGLLSVRCDCGTTKPMHGSILSGQHRRTTCGKRCPLGPWKHERASTPPREPRTHEQTAQSILLRLGQDARKRGLTITLTLDQFLVARGNDECHYCGTALSRTAPSLDRVDNDRGYEHDNVVGCCTMCNRTRGRHITYDEWMTLMRGRVARVGWGNAWPGYEERERDRVERARSTRLEIGAVLPPKKGHEQSRGLSVLTPRNIEVSVVRHHIQLCGTIDASSAVANSDITHLEAQ